MHANSAGDIDYWPSHNNIFVIVMQIKSTTHGERFTWNVITLLQ